MSICTTCGHALDGVAYPRATVGADGQPGITFICALCDEWVRRRQAAAAPVTESLPNQ